MLALRIGAVPALATALLVPLGPADGEDASPGGRAAQMTKAEYRQIKLGMSQEEVRRIVGSRGKIDTKDDDCIIRRYTSNQQAIDPHYRVTWTREEKGFEVYDKAAPNEFPFCPSGS